MKATLGASKILTDYTLEESQKIKDDLLLLNPDYINAKRYARNPRYIRIPEYRAYYKEEGGQIEVPLHYQIPEDIEVDIVDTRQERTVEFPESVITLREDQQIALDSYLEDTDNGIISMPTGKGKSILGIDLAYKLRQKTLIIVHKLDLMRGWEKDIKMCFNGKADVGRIQSKHRKIGDHYTLATIQTLNRLKEEELKKLQNEFGMVILDECLVGDTLIVREDGTLTTMAEIEDNERVWEGGLVSNKFSKKAETIKITCSAGDIEGSLNHKTLVLPKEKAKKRKLSKDDLEEMTLEEIREGDFLPVVRKIPHKTESKWTPDQLAFVSLIQADGHLDRVGHRIKVDVRKDIEYAREVFTKGARAFNKDVVVKETLDTRGDTTIWINDLEIKTILETEFKIPRGKKADIIDIPDTIFNAPLESIRSYIEVFFSCEGNLEVIESKYSSRAEVVVNSISKKFMQKFSLLLRKFGVVAYFQKVKRRKKTHADLYRLTVLGEEYNRFIEEFSLMDRKNYPFKNTGCLRKKFSIDNMVLQRVYRIEETGEEKEVFDFTTETHLYNANGILTHNCHHVPANTYAILDKISSAYRVGLSATPERTDGLTRVMYLYLGGLGYKHEYTKEDDDIMPVEVRVFRSLATFRPKARKEVHYRKTKDGRKKKVETFHIDNKGDYLLANVPYAKRPRIQSTVIDDIVVNDPRFKKRYLDQICQEYKKGRSIVVFLSQIKHCDMVRDELIAKKGIPEDKIQIYNGETEDREKVLQRAEEEDLITIVTYSIATEGTNIKRWEVAFMLSSINNGKNIEQAVGRIRRTTEGKISPVLVYDYSMEDVYSFSRHINTRKKRYKKILLDVKDMDKPSRPMFFLPDI